MDPSIHCLICVSNEVCEEPALWILFIMSYLLKCSMGNGVSTASNLCLFHEGVFVNYPSSSFAQRGVQKKKKKIRYEVVFRFFYNQECILTANLEYSVKTVYIIWEIKKKLIFQDCCAVYWLTLHSHRLFRHRHFVKFSSFRSTYCVQCEGHMVSYVWVQIMIRSRSV